MAPDGQGRFSSKSKAWVKVPLPLPLVPRVARHVGSGAAQHPGAASAGGPPSKSETVGRAEKQCGIQSVVFARPGATLRVRLDTGGGRAPVAILA